MKYPWVLYYFFFRIKIRLRKIFVCSIFVDVQISGWAPISQIFASHFPKFLDLILGKPQLPRLRFFSPINVGRIYFQAPRPHYYVSRYLENVVPGEKEKIRWLGDENDPSEVGACPTILPRKYPKITPNFAQNRPKIGKSTPKIWKSILRRANVTNRIGNLVLMVNMSVSIRL